MKEAKEMWGCIFWILAIAFLFWLFDGGFDHIGHFLNRVLG